jgi:hypothetical protein
MNEITLAGESLILCRAVVAQDLMKVTQLLASEKDGAGRKLTDHSRRELLGYSNRLQLLSLSLGTTSENIEATVKSFSKVDSK